MTTSARLDVDVLVAGAGPVGLAAATMAARSGARVLVIDPRDGVVDKACGEGLLPGALAALRRLGVDPPGAPFHGIAYCSPEGEARARFRSGSGRGVRRTTLSAALAAAADAAGVQRQQGRVGQVEQGEGWVRAAGRTARWLLAADGLHSPVRRTLGLDVPTGGRPRYGLRQHFEVTAWSEEVEVHWAPDAEAYVTPVAGGLVGVALLCGRGRTFDDRLADFPALRARLGAATAGPVLGAGPLRQRSRRRVAGNVLLVGDAAGYVDALTGEGLAVGLAGARAAVECLAAGRAEAYERRWRELTRSYRLLTGGLLWASRRPALRAALVPTARRLPRVFDTLVNAAAAEQAA